MGDPAREFEIGHFGRLGRLVVRRGVAVGALMQIRHRRLRHAGAQGRRLRLVAHDPQGEVERRQVRLCRRRHRSASPAAPSSHGLRRPSARAASAFRASGFHVDSFLMVSGRRHAGTLSVLAAETRASCRFYFRFRSPKGASLFCSQRGSRAPYGAPGMPALAKEHGTDPAGPASPYGAPLRRFQSLGPRFPLTRCRRFRHAARKGQGTIALGVIMGREADSKDSRDHDLRNRGRRRRSPSTFGSPSERPSVDGDDVQS